MEHVDDLFLLSFVPVKIRNLKYILHKDYVIRKTKEDGIKKE